MELLQQFSADSNEQILQLVLKEDELSWQHLIYDLVRREQMDPWDINLTILCGKFLTVIRRLKELDFRVSGKIVLASALLLKIKSDRLLDEDMNALDLLIQHTEEEDEPIDLLDSDGDALEAEEPEERPRIYPRSPQPRQRKVSVYDLVTALEQALEVNIRRERRALDRVDMPVVTIPEEHHDISDMMNQLLTRISTHTTDGLTFNHLIPGQEKLDKVLTFIPLLHLAFERRIDLTQHEHFGEIFIQLLSAEPVVYHTDA